MSQARCVLRVDGLDCPVEMKALNEALQGTPGVGSLGFDLILGTLSVAYDPDLIAPPEMIRRIASKAKMRSEVLGAPEVRGAFRAKWGRWILSATSGLLLLSGVLVEAWAKSATIVGTGLFILATLAGGIELFPRAWAGLRRFRLDIHALMAAATLGAAVTGQWEEAATIAFLFGLSEALESLSLGRARDAIRSLLDVTPESAERIEPDGSTRTVEARSLRLGDKVRVRSGERIPVDGQVISGRSSVDQSAITGESVPVLRELGDEVHAGSLNGDGALEVEATVDAADALVARIAASVREAQSRRAPIERSIERFSAWYTPAVFALSIALMVVSPLLFPSAGWREWFNRGLVVLVASCPCALVIATPVALASALAAAARKGILIKGGPFLEEFGRLKVLAFDKTGTLTLGEPCVVEVVGDDEDGLLRMAAALGDQGGHPLGRAISRHARSRRLEIPLAESYRAVPGLGASGLVDSVEYRIGSHRYLDESGLCPPDFHARLELAESRHGTAVTLSAPDGPLGWIRLADEARPEAARALAELNALGIRTVMLTGDNSTAAASVASQVGIEDRRSALLPDDKARIVAELNASQGSTGMVGDGVNDAPALAAARVSVALGGTSSASALETADVVLLNRDLTRLPWLVRQGRATLRRIRENIVLALGVKAVVLFLAATGIVSGTPALWMAIAADVGATLVVTANALRLLKGVD